MAKRHVRGVLSPGNKFVAGQPLTPTLRDQGWVAVTMTSHDKVSHGV